MIKGLDDLNDTKKDEKKKKTHNESYQGGTQSGLALDQGNNYDKIVENAQNTTNDPTRPTRVPNADKMVRITLYKNGFECNGQFFDNNDPATKQYLEDMMQSKITYDFMKKCNIDPKDEKEFELADKRSEEYRPPTPPKYVAFSGESHTTGKAQSTPLQGNEDYVREVDTAQRLVTVKVRLPSGKTKTVLFNPGESIDDFYNYLNIVAPVQGTFDLLSGFPPKPENEEEIPSLFYAPDAPNPYEPVNLNLVSQVARSNINISKSVLRKKLLLKDCVDQMSNPLVSEKYTDNELRKLKNNCTDDSHNQYINSIKSNYTQHKLDAYATLESLKKLYKGNWDLIDANLQKTLTLSKINSRETSKKNTRASTRECQSRSSRSLSLNNFNFFKSIYSSEKEASKNRKSTLNQNTFDLQTAPVLKTGDNKHITFSKVKNNVDYDQLIVSPVFSEKNQMIIYKHVYSPSLNEIEFNSNKIDNASNEIYIETKIVNKKSRVDSKLSNSNNNNKLEYNIHLNDEKNYIKENNDIYNNDTNIVNNLNSPILKPRLQFSVNNTSNSKLESEMKCQLPDTYKKLNYNNAEIIESPEKINYYNSSIASEDKLASKKLSGVSEQKEKLQEINKDFVRPNSSEAQVHQFYFMRHEKEPTPDLTDQPLLSPFKFPTISVHRQPVLDFQDSYHISRIKVSQSKLQYSEDLKVKKAESDAIVYSYDSDFRNKKDIKMSRILQNNRKIINYNFETRTKKQKDYEVRI